MSSEEYKDEEGFIYILTNESFPGWIKLGWAKDVSKRIDTLNGYASTPFSFHLYGALKTVKSNADRIIHKIIDDLDPTLRSIEKDEEGNITRKKEFYHCSPQRVYEWLKNMAIPLGREDWLIKPSSLSVKEEKESDVAKTYKNGGPITPDEYLASKSQYSQFVQLHNHLIFSLKSKVPTLFENATKNYISIKNEKGRILCEVHIQKSRIMLCTRTPKDKTLLIGEKVPETYLWALNYKVYFSSEKEIDNAVALLLDVLDQIS